MKARFLPDTIQLAACHTDMINKLTIVFRDNNNYLTLER